MAKNKPKPKIIIKALTWYLCLELRWFFNSLCGQPLKQIPTLYQHHLRCKHQIRQAPIQAYLQIKSTLQPIKPKRFIGIPPTKKKNANN